MISLKSAMEERRRVMLSHLSSPIHLVVLLHMPCQTALLAALIHFKGVAEKNCQVDATKCIFYTWIDLVFEYLPRSHKSLPVQRTHWVSTT